VNFDLVIGGALCAVGLALLFIGLPRNGGVSPRFLQFAAATILYPPLVMVFLVLGTAEIISALF
jgi:hypothetical protein